MFQRRWRSLALMLALAVVMALGSCGRDPRRLPVYPTQGKLFVDDKPAAGAFVYLWPKGIAKELDAYSPHGQTDDTGEFKLSTYVEGDGAPAGEYTVTLEWPERYNPISTRWEGDKLKGGYRDAKSSKLTVTIEKKPNELPAIRVAK